MGSNSAGNEADHVIQVWEVNKDRLAAMQQKISTKPKLLSLSAGRSSCCIFRVPQTLIDINGRSYQPHVVSIGPLHRGEPHLETIQEHKWRFLGGMLNRTQSKGLSLEDCLTAIQPLEMRARECYSETLSLDANEFIEMLVLDGCFLIELLRKIGKVVPFERDDPFISMSWVYSFFSRDLIRLENQVPFFILQRLFDLSQMPGEKSGHSLTQLALDFFNYSLQRPEHVIGKYTGLQPKHLLDLLRSTFLPQEENKPKASNGVPSHVIQSISNLRRAGIQLRPGRKEDSFLVVKFKRGVIEMPKIAIDDFMSCFMINCIAFEQCHKNCSTHFTTYATLLDCLMNTSKDVGYLCERSIIENYFGTDLEVANLINNLGKDVSFDIDQSYLANLFNDVNQYYKNNWHVYWAGFVYTYFSSPWSFISVLAAIVLLVLAVIQTYYTVVGYVRPKP
ncbi:UPF0481 protein At3g47200-like [Diospyros lotus]|uniref:UPF0481 protein At3g47200-like n=1 Tax=Diospyros lotus TaxID=55363 RepID=UPI002254128C|nr:UPF0481 protein At3g47200-like [Diospyros lotus]